MSKQVWGVSNEVSRASNGHSTAPNGVSDAPKRGMMFRFAQSDTLGIL